MTREEFIKVLEEKGYSYEIIGDKIVVTHKGDVDLDSLETLPPEVKFENKGYVDLRSLTSLPSLPSGVEFKNEGGVSLNSLETLPPDVGFENGGDVGLNSLTSIPSGVEFRNGSRYIELDSLTGGWFSAWNGNIEGISSNRLLNKMISDGLFDRR